jgi:cell division protein FtsB
MQKILALILLGLILWLQYRILYGENSLEKLQVLSIKIEEQQEQNALLAKQNKRLKQEIYWLRNEPEILEEKARENLGLIKKDELFYRIIPLETN